MLSISPLLKSRIMPSLGAIGSSLLVNQLVGSAGQSFLQNSPPDSKKEYAIQFAQIFSAILAAVFTSRALTNGPFRLASWTEARNAINTKSLLLAGSVALLNIGIEFFADIASKAQVASQSAQKWISGIELGLRLVGSILLARLIGGANPDATAGAVVGCPCCGSPFVICLMDIVAIIQSFFQSGFLNLNNLISGLQNKTEPALQTR